MPKESAIASGLPEAERVRILLADGDPERAAGLAAMLEGASLEPVRAETCEAALRHLRENPDFCLILLDEALPGSSGDEPARPVLDFRGPLGIPFMLIGSRLPDEARLARGYALGAADYLFPPMLPHVLQAKAGVFAELYRKSRRVNHLVGELEQAVSEKTEALFGSEDRFRLLIENVRDYAIFMADLKGRITSWNPGVERILGYAEEEFIGRRGCMIFTPEDIAAKQPEAELRTALEKGTASDERWHVRKDGSRFWALGVMTAVRDRRGAAVGVAKIMRDFTERLRAEEQLRQAQKLEAVGRLAGGVAHDFNNLLTAINGYCDLLMDATGPEDARYGYLREIRNAGTRAAALTNHLLAYSRNQILSPKVLDLNSVLNNVEAFLGRLLGEDIHLSLDLDPAAGKIRADLGQVEQVVLNLVLNAKDAMPAGGEVRIRSGSEDVRGGNGVGDPTLPPGRYAVLSVSDSGMGMDEAVKTRIFEPFFTTKKIGKGSGLGLSSVYGIMKQSRGTITVQSEPGKGSTFNVFFPSAEMPDSQQAPATLAPLGSDA